VQLTRKDTRVTALDASEADQEPQPRYRWMNLYQRFLDWLWFGPLTRDVRWRYPTYYPSTLKVACSLPGEFCRFCWSWLLTYVERFRRPGV
jgi:hypothetical protein